MNIFTTEQDDILIRSSEIWYFRYKFKDHIATDNQIKNRRKYLLSLKRKAGKILYSKNTSNEYNIEKFTYNGFFGQSLPGIAKYKVKFNKWSLDPGIILMDCSDGMQRLIPSWAMIGENDLPKQDIKINSKTGMAEVLFGMASKS